MIILNITTEPCLTTNGSRVRDPHQSTGLSSQGPVEDHEGEDEQGSQNREGLVPTEETGWRSRPDNSVGQWCYFAALAEKYGLVSLPAMPDTAASKDGNGFLVHSWLVQKSGLLGHWLYNGY